MASHDVTRSAKETILSSFSCCDNYNKGYKQQPQFDSMNALFRHVQRVHKDLVLRMWPQEPRHICIRLPDGTLFHRFEDGTRIHDGFAAGEVSESSQLVSRKEWLQQGIDHPLFAGCITAPTPASLSDIPHREVSRSKANPRRDILITPDLIFDSSSDTASELSAATPSSTSEEQSIQDSPFAYGDVRSRTETPSIDTETTASSAADIFGPHPLWPERSSRGNCFSISSETEESMDQKDPYEESQEMDISDTESDATVTPDIPRGSLGDVAMIGGDRFKAERILSMSSAAGRIVYRVQWKPFIVAKYHMRIEDDIAYDGHAWYPYKKLTPDNGKWIVHWKPTWETSVTNPLLQEFEARNGHRSDRTRKSDAGGPNIRTWKKVKWSDASYADSGQDDMHE